MVKNLKILLIDNNVRDLDSFEETIRQHNLNASENNVYHLVAKRNLVEAFEFLETKEGQFVDVIVLDLSLPDSCGLRAVKIFREKIPFKPLIVFTSASNEDLALSALNEGAQEVLLKENYNVFSLKLSLNHAIRKANLTYEINKKNLELETLNKKLEKAYKAKSSFLASMSHEMRTPLNSILGMAQILKENVKRKENIDYIDIIMRAGENLLELISGVLDLSKIETGEVKSESTSFNLEDVVEKSVEMMGVRASQKNLDLILNLKKLSTKFVIGDKGKIQQILLNLMSNAIKFTQEGEVVLKVEPYRNSASPNHVFFSVSDTGMGVPKNKQELVFENFTQADSTITRRFGGSGLGLSISRNLVDLMGGSLKLKSIEGHGSTFFFDIPFQVDACADLSRSDEGNFLKSKKVIVIEKSKTQINVLEEMLEEFSMMTKSFQKFEAAMDYLSSLESSGVDIILLDSRFIEGEMKSYFEKLKKYSNLSSKLIVILKPNYERKDVKMIRYFGAKRYLIKPLLKSSVRDAIQNIIKVKPILVEEEKEQIRDERLLHILYADDCDLNRMLFRLFLKSTTHTLHFAENGQEAVEKTVNGKYDIVFLDVQMPVKDGLTAAREIREWEEKNDKEPVLICSLTAHAMKEDIKKSLDAGCNHHITKPVKKDVLLKYIRKYSRDC